MPHPVSAIIVLALMYLFCLFISFLLSIIYGKHKSAPPTDDDCVFYVEKTPSRRRRKRTPKTIAIKGKLISGDKTADSD